MAQQPDDEARGEAMLKKLEELGAKVFFEKQLTSSDVSTTGRIVVPKAIAEQYLPKIDAPSGIELEVQDAAGSAYKLRFRFWVNNQSRMYLLEGTAALQHQYHLKSGDVFIFAQKADGTVVLAGRPPTPADAAKKPPLKRPSPMPSTSARPASNRPQRAKDSSRWRRGQRPYNSLAGDDDPPADGVFRALQASGDDVDQASGIKRRDKQWLATLNLAGELYQAIFDREEDALEALNAAGFEQPGAGTAA